MEGLISAIEVLEGGDIVVLVTSDSSTRLVLCQERYRSTELLDQVSPGTLGKSLNGNFYVITNDSKLHSFESGEKIGSGISIGSAQASKPVVLGRNPEMIWVNLQKWRPCIYS